MAQLGIQEVRDLLVDVQEVVASHGAFAARLANGHVVTWGNPLYGGAQPVRRWMGWTKRRGGMRVIGRIARPGNGCL